MYPPGCAPLYAAARSGHTEAVKLLLQHGAHINLTTNAGKQFFSFGTLSQLINMYGLN